MRCDPLPEDGPALAVRQAGKGKRKLAVLGGIHVASPARVEKRRDARLATEEQREKAADAAKSEKDDQGFMEAFDACGLHS